jgi:uncharacterized protein
VTQTIAGRRVRLATVAAGVAVAAMATAGSVTSAWAQDISINFGAGGGLTERVLQLVALMTVLSLAPSILVMVTSFTRIVVVLSLLRTALGTATAPPNTVIISLALFLTAYVMGPAFERAYDLGVKPLVNNEISAEQAFERASDPFRVFMLKNVREKDLKLFVDMSHEAAPARPRDRISPVPALPGHRSRGGFGADVDGHDDAAAGGGIAAVQAHLLRAGGRLEPGGGQPGAELRDVTAPRRDRAAATPAALRAWQRMLSGRRLDLLDPSPLDIEIEDIAHGLARVARWNGQTHGDHIFSVAQHTLLVEEVARRRTGRVDRRLGLALLLHDAPEYVIGDMISPFKAVIGGAYRAVERRLLVAIHVRFGLPPELPAEIHAIIKAADRGAAFLEATALAGFGVVEARRLFGPRPILSSAAEKDYLIPWAAETAKRRFLERFAGFAEN